MPELGDEITVDELSTTGVTISDNFGNTWVLPSEELEDFSDFALPEPLSLPVDKLDKRFHYQFCRTDELAANISRGFVAVTRGELGFKALPESIARDYGQQQDSIYRVNEMICIKIPVQFKLYADRLKQRAADDAVKGAGATDAMLEFAQKRGIKMPTPMDQRRPGPIDGVSEDVDLRVTRVDEPLTRRR